MSNVGQRERITQRRIVQFFKTDLGYRYLGDWQDRSKNNIWISCSLIGESDETS